MDSLFVEQIVKLSNDALAKLVSAEKKIKELELENLKLQVAKLEAEKKITELEDKIQELKIENLRFEITNLEKEQTKEKKKEEEKKETSAEEEKANDIRRWNSRAVVDESKKEDTSTEVEKANDIRRWNSRVVRDEPKEEETSDEDNASLYAWVQNQLRPGRPIVMSLGGRDYYGNLDFGHPWGKK